MDLRLIKTKSTPDGHTLMMAPSAHTVNVSLYRALPYDPIKDFEAVSLVAQTPLLLTVHPSLPVKNVKELAALARAKPGQLIRLGPGSFDHARPLDDFGFHIGRKFFCGSAHGIYAAGDQPLAHGGFLHQLH